VTVGEQKVPGVIGIKPYHLVSAKEELAVPRTDELYIDIGAKDKADALKWVHLGDQVAFRSDAVEFGSGFLKAKAIDDRAGCAVLLNLLAEPLPMDCTFVFTAQEEVGARGAFGAAFSVTPEIAMILEGTTAADCSTAEEHRQVCWPGRGPVLSLMDGGAIYDRALFELLKTTAEEEGIPWQVKHYLSGGTDAQAIQRTKVGVRVCGISAAVRYLHTPSSVCAVSDLEHMFALARAFLARCADLAPEGKDD
jgi:endoglucanase